MPPDNDFYLSFYYLVSYLLWPVYVKPGPAVGCGELRYPVCTVAVLAKPK